MGFNLAERTASLTEEQAKRLQKVKDEQLRIGMTPRNDSILTYNFAIRDVPDYLDDAKTVAHELAIVDFIHKNTKYGELIEDVMREVASHICSKYRLDWTTTWKLTRFYVPDMLKLYCVRQAGVALPTF